MVVLTFKNDYSLFCGAKNGKGEACEGPLKVAWQSTRDPDKWTRYTECTVCHVRGWKQLELSTDSGEEPVLVQCPVCKVYVNKLIYTGDRKRCEYCKEEEEIKCI